MCISFGGTQIQQDRVHHERRHYRNLSFQRHINTCFLPPPLECNLFLRSPIQHRILKLLEIVIEISALEIAPICKEDLVDYYRYVLLP